MGPRAQSRRLRAGPARVHRARYHAPNGPRLIPPASEPRPSRAIGSPRGPRLPAQPPTPDRGIPHRKSNDPSHRLRTRRRDADRSPVPAKCDSPARWRARSSPRTPSPGRSRSPASPPPPSSSTRPPPSPRHPRPRTHRALQEGGARAHQEPLRRHRGGQAEGQRRQDRARAQGGGSASKPAPASKPASKPAPAKKKSSKKTDSQAWSGGARRGGRPRRPLRRQRHPRRRRLVHLVLRVLRFQRRQVRSRGQRCGGAKVDRQLEGSSRRRQPAWARTPPGPRRRGPGVDRRLEGQAVNTGIISENTNLRVNISTIIRLTRCFYRARSGSSRSVTWPPRQPPG